MCEYFVENGNFLTPQSIENDDEAVWDDLQLKGGFRPLRHYNSK